MMIMVKTTAMIITKITIITHSRNNADHHKENIAIRKLHMPSEKPTYPAEVAENCCRKDPSVKH